MPVSKNMKRTMGVTRKSHSKAPGTRVGVLLDWREGSAKAGKTSDRCGSVVRDGR